MAVRIRLARMGKKKRPSYRVVVVDSRKPRYTHFIDEIGYYNPVAPVPEVKIDIEKVKDWIKRGAQVTQPVARLLKSMKKEIPDTEVNHG